MNVRPIAGGAILALAFGAWFVCFGLDEGWVTASLVTLGIAALVALIWVAVKLIFDGMEGR